MLVRQPQLKGVGIKTEQIWIGYILTVETSCTGTWPVL